jgi:hypothetical protein
MRVSVLLVIGYMLVGCDPKGDKTTATATAGETTTGTTGGTTTEVTTGGATSPTTTTADATTVEATTADTSSTTNASTTTGDVPADMCACAGACARWLCDPVDQPAVNDEALACTLTALRDRTPGSVEWSWRTCSDGPCDERIVVYILEDGTVRRNPYSDQVFCSTSGPDTRNTLKDPKYFDGCLAKADFNDGFDCMNDAFLATLEECFPYTEECS